MDPTALTSLDRSWRLWAAWTAFAGIALLANPATPFGWPELVAILGPVVLLLDRRTRRELLLAIGLPAIGLLVHLDGASGVLRLVADWGALIGGALLASRALEDQIDFERQIVGLVAGEDPDWARERFAEAAEREIARARRHERPFGVLSITPQRPVPDDAAGPTSRVLAELSERRELREIARVLDHALHRYATIAVFGGRCVALVPEAEPTDRDALVSRLAKAIEVQLGIGSVIGLALFPDSGITLERLIEEADAARQATRLESVGPPAPVASSEHESGPPEAR